MKSQASAMLLDSLDMADEVHLVHAEIVRPESLATVDLLATNMDTKIVPGSVFGYVVNDFGVEWFFDDGNGHLMGRDDMDAGFVGYGNGSVVIVKRVSKLVIYAVASDEKKERTYMDDMVLDVKPGAGAAVITLLTTSPSHPKETHTLSVLSVGTDEPVFLDSVAYDFAAGEGGEARVNDGVLTLRLHTHWSGSVTE